MYFIVSTISSLINFYSFNDIVIIACLGYMISSRISKAFIKNENRFFNGTEFKIMVNRCSLIAYVISAFFYMVMDGYYVFVRFFLTPDQLDAYIKYLKANNSDFIFFITESPIIFSICTGGMLIVYYLLIRFTIHRTMKIVGMRYKMKNEKIAVENSN
jgi:hypothetical protein